MFKVELTQDDLNTIGTCIDIALKHNGVAMIDDAFLVLTKLRSAVPVGKVEDNTQPETKKSQKS